MIRLLFRIFDPDFFGKLAKHLLHLRFERTVIAHFSVQIQKSHGDVLFFLFQNGGKQRFFQSVSLFDPSADQVTFHRALEFLFRYAYKK